MAFLHTQGFLGVGGTNQKHCWLLEKKKASKILQKNALKGEEKVIKYPKGL